MKYNLFILLLLIFENIYAGDTIFFVYKSKEYEETICKKNSLSKDEVLSIPIFSMKKDHFYCGSYVDIMINFNNNPKNQIGLVFCEKSFKKYIWIEDPYSPIYGETIKNNDNPKRVFNYIKKHPDLFVFKINGFCEYWVIKKGRVYNLSMTLLGGILLDASQYLCGRYGEDLVNDMKRNVVKIARPYYKCNQSICNDFDKDDRKVYVKIIYD